jgi:hypothetical protein
MLDRGRLPVWAQRLRGTPSQWEVARRTFGGSSGPSTGTNSSEVDSVGSGGCKCAERVWSTPGKPGRCICSTSTVLRWTVAPDRPNRSTGLPARGSHRPAPSAASTPAARPRRAHGTPRSRAAASSPTRRRPGARRQVGHEPRIHATLESSLWCMFAVTRRAIPRAKRSSPLGRCRRSSGFRQLCARRRSGATSHGIRTECWCASRSARP